MEMSYLLTVEYPERDNIDFWERFMNESGFLSESNHDINHYLAPWRAKNVHGEPFIEFETEEDATLFLLRWA